MAAGATYEPIATTTISTATATVTFSNIPATYTDIVLVANFLQDGSATATNGFVQLNSTTTGYSRTNLEGNGSAAGSNRDSNADRMYFTVDATSSNWVVSIWNFQNYANTNVKKTVLVRQNSANSLLASTVYLWSNTAAISTISITASDNRGSGTADKFVSGSTFTLYGIAAA